MATSKNTYKQYKWYLDDNLIIGATKYLYVANNKLGTYRVEVADENQCFTKSDDIVIPTKKAGMTNFNIPADYLIGEGTDDLGNLKIYPNPTSGLIKYEMDNKLYGDLIITVFTHDGKEILKQKARKDIDYHYDNIDLTRYPKGNYLIKFDINNTIAIKKVIVE
jgi:hypothetical protein